MQRSCKAFLKRKALNSANSRKSSCNKFFLSLLIVFLFNFYIGHGHDNSGASRILVDQICWPEAKPGLIKGFFPEVECLSADTCSEFCDLDAYTTSVECEDSGSEIQSKQESQNYVANVKQVEVENFVMEEGSQKDNTPKSDRLLHDAPLGFDEFKSKVLNPRGKSAAGQAGSIMHKVEPGGKEYNYASASKGAKVLAFNKEGKGASNILGKDMDKYLLNPCSAEGKFVVIELSEETLVETIELANLEHHSSNFKDFELLGSLVYPTETWVELGNFTAKNVKQSQRFTLQEPKWVRYLRINLLSHYGSEFYCTLSDVQVYGVDAVERMLEDLISVQDNIFAGDESTEEQKPVTPWMTHSQTNGPYQNFVTEGDPESPPEDSKLKHDASNSEKGDQVGELRPQLVGRIPGDSVLKILMQKVRSLDLNLSVLERYLEELNSRYGNIFENFGKEVAEKDVLLEKMRSDITNLVDRKKVIVKDVSDIISWKSLVSLQMDYLKSENAFLRSEVERIVENQAHVENKIIIVLLVSSSCCFFAIIKLFVDMAVVVCRRKQEFRRFCGTNLSSIVLLLSCSIIGVILLL